MVSPSHLFSIISLLMVAPILSQAPECKGSGTYRVEYDYIWDSSNFDNVPSGAHFSPLVVFAHKITYSAFTEYGYSSNGVQNVAETGSFQALRNELNTARENGFVGDIQVNQRIPDGDGSASVMLSMNCSFPYISAISMVAPSPDWIAPVFRFPVLKKKNLKFKKKGKRSVKVWDAGTDSGRTLNANNAPTSPRENIHPLVGAPFDRKTIAMFSIALQK